MAEEQDYDAYMHEFQCPSQDRAALIARITTCIAQEWGLVAPWQTQFCKPCSCLTAANRSPSSQTFARAVSHQQQESPS